MHIRCPHCHNAIEIIEDSSFRDVECPSCGSHFNLASEAPTQSGPSRPRMLAHYELLEQVGVGHFGAVWKARDTTLDRLVALKIPRRDQIDESEVDSFFREARAAAQLKHPNIVGVHEVGRERETIYIASDYVDGATLKEWLKGQPLPPREAAQLCATIADALHVAHEAGVVHRDLKPQNIMMDVAGQPYVMDFGLAKRESGEITVTIEGIPIGTPAYMPPEQAAGKGHDADRRSDVYSLGVILFEMLTGDLPFRGETRMLMVQIQREEPPRPRRLNDKIPRDLETICLKCLEKSPEKRYQSAGELSDDLERFLAGRPIKARRIGRAARGWRWAKRNPTVASLAASVVLALLAGIASTSYWARTADAQRRRAVDSLVHALSTASPSQVPDALDALRPFDNARLTLEKQYADTTGQQKLHAAYGLAEFGQVEVEFLVDAVNDAALGECRNLVVALRHQRNAALMQLQDAAAMATVDENWRVKTRLATVAAYLGDMRPMEEMLREDQDLKGNGLQSEQRIWFTSHFREWPGDLIKLAQVLESKANESVRTGMCIAVGKIEEPPDRAKETWRELLINWNVVSKDACTHSSTKWALQRWSLGIPDIVLHPERQYDWWPLQHGRPLTMLRIRAGEFTHQSRLDIRKGSRSLQVTVSTDYWLSDCEVPIGLYMRFLLDDSYHGDKPREPQWPHFFDEGRLKGLHPAQNVSWYDAVMFCNWLSWKEQLPKCYDIVLNDQTSGGYIVNLSDTGGFRLPTEAEWEYACRAGSTTNYTCGDDVQRLKEFAVFGAIRTEPVGSRLYNRWGLFDVHGNVVEWCWNEYYDSFVNSSKYRSPSAEHTRVGRGGGWKDQPIWCRSSDRRGYGPEDRNSVLGFRLAAGSSFLQAMAKADKTETAQ